MQGLTLEEGGDRPVTPAHGMLQVTLVREQQRRALLRFSRPLLGLATHGRCSTDQDETGLPLLLLCPPFCSWRGFTAGLLHAHPGAGPRMLPRARQTRSPHVGGRWYHLHPQLVCHYGTTR